MLRALAVATLAAGLLLAPPPATQAQRGGLQIRTNYPSVEVGAGKSVTLNLKVVAPSPRPVAIDVIETPPGWQATLRGGGFVIHGVFAQPEEEGSTPPDIQLEVKVPPDTPPGDYRVVVRASGGGTDTLPLGFRVSEKAQGAVTLTADFPTFRGASDATFTFKLTLSNNTPEKTSFNLSAQGPRGWKVTARPTAETRAATVTVEGGGTQQVEVEADPPDDTEAGSYEVKVLAEGGGQSAEAPLTVEITGNISLELSTTTDRLNTDAVAGRTKDLQFEVRNNGTAPLRGVTLTATPPTGWEVTFSPDTVAEVEPGSRRRVTAKITPSGDAVAGDYNVTMTASAEGTTDTAELRVAVKTSRFWGFVGLLLILGTAYALVRVFRKYGRR